jgi:hypothetical protein
VNSLAYVNTDKAVMSYCVLLHLEKSSWLAARIKVSYVGKDSVAPLSSDMSIAQGVSPGYNGGTAS